jgi:hypothetical protein
MKEKINFVGEPEGKRPLSRSRRGLDDIKMNLTEIGLEAWNGVGLVQDRYQW